MLRWERKTHDGYIRFYEVRLERDLLNDLVLTRVWGRKGGCQGGISHELMADKANAAQVISAIGRDRIKHGYRLIARAA